MLQYLVQALYDFTPQEVGELEFKRGDVITVTGKPLFFYTFMSVLEAKLMFLSCDQWKFEPN